MAKEAYIVIDIGTGNVRVAVAATTGDILGIERENIIYHKDENYPEALYFDPQQLWDQVTVLTKSALAQAGDVQVLALTATSQREGIAQLAGQKIGSMDPAGYFFGFIRIGFYKPNHLSQPA